MDHKNKGNDLLRQQDYNGALECYTAAIAVEENPVFYHNRSVVYTILRCYYKALDDANKAIDLNALYFKAYFRKALILVNQGKHLAALRVLEEAISRHPDYTFGNSSQTETEGKEKFLGFKQSLLWKKYSPVFKKLAGLYLNILNTVPEIISDPSIFLEVMKVTTSESMHERSEKIMNNTEDNSEYDLVLSMIEQLFQLDEIKKNENLCKWTKSPDGVSSLEGILEKISHNSNPSLNYVFKLIRKQKSNIHLMIKQIFRIRRLILQDPVLARKELDPFVLSHSAQNDDECSIYWKSFLRDVLLDVTKIDDELLRICKGKYKKDSPEMKTMVFLDKINNFLLALSFISKELTKIFFMKEGFQSDKKVEKIKRMMNKKKMSKKKKEKLWRKLSQHCPFCPNLQDQSFEAKDDVSEEVIEKIRSFDMKSGDYKNLYNYLLELSWNVNQNVLILQDEVICRKVFVLLKKQIKEENHKERSQPFFHERDVFCILANLVASLDGYEKHDYESVKKKILKVIEYVLPGKKYHQELLSLQRNHLIRFIANLLLWRPRMSKYFAFIIPNLVKVMERNLTSKNPKGRVLERNVDLLRFITILCTCKDICLNEIAAGFYPLLEKLGYQYLDDTHIVNRYTICANKYIRQNCEIVLKKHVQSLDEEKYPQLKLTRPKFDFIPSFPDFMRNDKWRFGNLITGLFAKKSYVGFEFSGHVILYRTVYSNTMRMNLLFALSISLYNNELRDVTYSDPYQNTKKKEKKFFKFFSLPREMMSDKYNEWRSLAPLKDEIMLNIVSTAMKCTKRKLTSYERDGMKILVGAFKKIKPKPRQSVLDVLMKGIGTIHHHERFSFSECRSILRSVPFRLFFAQYGDFNLIGYFPPNPKAEIRTNFGRLPNPIPKIVVSYIVQISKVIDKCKDWKFMKGKLGFFEMLYYSFNAQAFYFRCQKRFQIAHEFLKSAKELKDGKEVMQIPLVLAFLERSSYYFNANIRVSINFDFCEGIYRNYGLREAIGSTYTKCLNLVSVIYHPRPNYQDMFIDFMTSFILKRQKRNRKINMYVFIKQIELFLKTHKDHYSEDKLRVSFARSLKYIGKLVDKYWGKLKSEIRETGFEDFESTLLKNLEKKNEKKMRKSLNKKCNHCGVYGDKKCGRCSIVFYCSRKCQISDWKTHKNVCKK